MASGGSAARAAEEPPPPEPPAEQKPPPQPPAQEEFSFLPLVHDIIKCWSFWEECQRDLAQPQAHFHSESHQYLGGVWVTRRCGSSHNPGAYTQQTFVILPSPKRDTEFKQRENLACSVVMF
ncbi:mediator of RNA polymerase II transcription subunit 9 isoform X4 [Strix aluco]|uniref:mediator of RNA polymerase II transcription subunit 9 isoform X4 n=1 Tax=Strix aluco TaxID=111821 RepID=UPI003DA341D2